MANESLVSSIASNLIPKIVDDARFVAEQSVIMPSLVANYNGRGMATRYLGAYAQGTATVVSEGAGVGTYSEFAKTQDVALTPQIAQIESLLSDERVETDPDDAARDIAVYMGNGIGRKVDTDLVNLFASATTSKGATGSAITLTMAAAALAVLRKNNTPNPINFVWHPYHWHDLWVALGSPSANQAFLGEVANQALRDYYTGQALGAMHYVDSNISAQGGSGTVAGTVFSGVFNPIAIALDVRTPFTVDSERKATKRGTELAGYVRYAVGIRAQSHLVSIKGDATEPT